MSELLYYTIYNAAVGAAIGFYLFDRLQERGLVLFATTATSTILIGTLVNESFVEPYIFDGPPLNGEGFYYGLMDSVWTVASFLLFRLAEWKHLHRRRRSTLLSPARMGPGSDADATFVVRVGRQTRKIHAADVLYMRADRDFTHIVGTDHEHLVSENLKSVLDKSGRYGLFRVHKSFAINLNRLESLTRSRAGLGDLRVPVGRRYWPAVSEAWNSRSATPGEASDQDRLPFGR